MDDSKIIKLLFVNGLYKGIWVSFLIGRNAAMIEWGP